MIQCRAGKLYTGHTDDLERRMAQHQSGLVSGYTQARRPLELVWSQEFPSRYEALSAEQRIKGWSKRKKLALIRGDWSEISRLAKSASTSSARTGLLVADSVLNGLLAEAVLAAPFEACGLLLGGGERIERATSCTNVHPTPRTHFEIDPAALIAAHRAERMGGPPIAGYWHSHPTGSAAPSPTDRASASGDGRVWAIVADNDVTFWRDTPAGLEPLSYMVRPG